MKQQIFLVAALAALGIVTGDSGQSIGAESAKADPATSFFVTSSGSKTANLGGLKGADKICQNLATAVGLGNKTWHAYLSAAAATGQPPVNAPPIGLQLGLARTASTHSTTGSTTGTASLSGQ